MFILETRFGDVPRNDKQRIYTVARLLLPTDSGWYQQQSMINCFFHRMANDRIRYNVTNIRQFTRHQEDERQHYNWDWLTYVDVDTLDAFFERIGFDYRAKRWADPNEFSTKRK